MATSRKTSAGGSVFLIRFAVGLIFFVEGVLKFMLADELGAGRFAKIGIPWPHLAGPFVGGVEIVCGALIVLGLFTRLATILLLIDIGVAIAATKVPILLGHAYGPFALPPLPHYGLLMAFHEARTDFAMLLGLLFLLVTGAGSCSFDSIPAAPSESEPSA